MSGLSLDLTKFFGGKGVLPMSGIAIAGAAYLSLRHLTEFPLYDAIIGGICFGILSILIFIGIGEVLSRIKRRKKFNSLTPRHIRYIMQDIIKEGDGYSSHAIELSPLMELEDKGVLTRLTVEGTRHYKYKITDWALAQIKKDPRFTNPPNNASSI